MVPSRSPWGLVRGRVPGTVVARGLGARDGGVGVDAEKVELHTAAAGRGFPGSGPEGGCAAKVASAWRLEHQLPMPDDGEIVGEAVDTQAEDIRKEPGQPADIAGQQVQADAREAAAKVSAETVSRSMGCS